VQICHYIIYPSTASVLYNATARCSIMQQLGADLPLYYISFRSLGALYNATTRCKSAIILYPSAASVLYNATTRCRSAIILYILPQTRCYNAIVEDEQGMPARPATSEVIMCFMSLNYVTLICRHPPSRHAGISTGSIRDIRLLHRRGGCYKGGSGWQRVLYPVYSGL
jgi:hypothetical protein